MKIEKLKCDFEIVEIENLEGFLISNKNKDEKITIYDEELKREVFAKNFNKKYRELLYLVMDINASDDATSTDASLALMKIDDLREKLVKKYAFLTKNELNRYLKMLMLLNEKLNIPERNRGR